LTYLRQLFHIYLKLTAFWTSSWDRWVRENRPPSGESGLGLVTDPFYRINPSELDLRHGGYWPDGSCG